MNVAHNTSAKARTGDIRISENIKFAGLLLSENVQKGLVSAGFSRPSPIQLKGIPLGRCGLDLIVQAKSGTGKTCVFTVIALEGLELQSYSTQVLVLAPTREIALQIADVVRAIGCHIEGLQCHTFIGGLPVQEDAAKLKKCHIAIGSPGRIKQLIENDYLATDSIRLFVLDEADKLMEEGFQEQINWIYSTLPETKQMLALSATYPEYLAQHLTAYMKQPTFVRLNALDPALLGIKQFYCSVPYHPLVHKLFELKAERLVQLLSTVSFHQCLVFSNYQLRAQTLSEVLNSKGWPSAFISGSQDQHARIDAMDKLKNFQCRVLISTDLTSRGIDAERVNLVVNLDLPRDHETYLHRIGRAGRFGSFGAAVSLVSEGTEFDLMRNIESMCKTHIEILPDPIPADLTEPVADICIDDLVSTHKIETSSDIPPSTDDNEETKHSVKEIDSDSLVCGILNPVKIMLLLYYSKDDLVKIGNEQNMNCQKYAQISDAFNSDVAMVLISKCEQCFIENKDQRSPIGSNISEDLCADSLPDFGTKQTSVETSTFGNSLCMDEVTNLPLDTIDACKSLTEKIHLKRLEIFEPVEPLITYSRDILLSMQKIPLHFCLRSLSKIMLQTHFVADRCGDSCRAIDGFQSSLVQQLHSRNVKDKCDRNIKQSTCTINNESPISTKTDTNPDVNCKNLSVNDPHKPMGEISTIKTNNFERTDASVLETLNIPYISPLSSHLRSTRITFPNFDQLGDDFEKCVLHPDIIIKDSNLKTNNVAYSNLIIDENEVLCIAQLLEDAPKYPTFQHSLPNIVTATQKTDDTYDKSDVTVKVRKKRKQRNRQSKIEVGQKIDKTSTEKLSKSVDGPDITVVNSLDDDGSNAQTMNISEYNRGDLIAAQKSTASVIETGKEVNCSVIDMSKSVTKAISENAKVKINEVMNADANVITDTLSKNTKKTANVQKKTNKNSYQKLKNKKKDTKTCMDDKKDCGIAKTAKKGKPVVKPIFNNVASSYPRTSWVEVQPPPTSKKSKKSKASSKKSSQHPTSEPNSTRNYYNDSEQYTHDDYNFHNFSGDYCQEDIHQRKNKSYESFPNDQYYGFQPKTYANNDMRYSDSFPNGQGSSEQDKNLNGAPSADDRGKFPWLYNYRGEPNAYFYASGMAWQNKIPLFDPAATTSYGHCECCQFSRRNAQLQLEANFKMQQYLHRAYTEQMNYLQQANEMLRSCLQQSS